MKTTARLKKLILYLFISVIIILSVLTVYYMTGITWRCPFNLITGLIFNNRGLYCPGCGSTRAVMKYIHLDFKGGFMMNMLFPLELIYIIYVLAVSCVSYIKNGRFNYRSPNKAVDITVLVIILIWWVVRNIFNI